MHPLQRAYFLSRPHGLRRRHRPSGRENSGHTGLAGAKVRSRCPRLFQFGFLLPKIRHSIAEPLSALTKKGVRFSWSPEAQQAFEHLKRALAETVTLAYPQPDQTFILDTDSSDVAVAAILSTTVEVERPIAFSARD